MKTNTAEQLKKAYEDVSLATKEILFSPDIDEQVKKYGTSIVILTDGIKILNELTNLAILKLIDEKEFEEELSTELKIDRVVAEKITSDIFYQVITPIREREQKNKDPASVDIIKSLDSQKMRASAKRHINAENIRKWKSLDIENIIKTLAKDKK